MAAWEKVSPSSTAPPGIHHCLLFSWTQRYLPSLLQIVKAYFAIFEPDMKRIYYSIFQNKKHPFISLRINFSNQPCEFGCNGQSLRQDYNVKIGVAEQFGRTQPPDDERGGVEGVHKQLPHRHKRIAGAAGDNHPPEPPPGRLPRGNPELLLRATASLSQEEQIRTPAAVPRPHASHI